MRGTFDKAVASGEQRWAFNYVTDSESFTNMASIGTTLNILELSGDRTSANITAEVESFIDSTKW